MPVTLRARTSWPIPPNALKKARQRQVDLACAAWIRTVTDSEFARVDGSMSELQERWRLIKTCYPLTNCSFHLKFNQVVHLNGVPIGSLETGFAKSVSNMVRASASEQPRLIRYKTVSSEIWPTVACGQSGAVALRDIHLWMVSNG